MKVTNWFGLLAILRSGSCTLVQARRHRQRDRRLAKQYTNENDHFVEACNFHFKFHRGDEPSGGVFAGGNKLIVPDDSGKLLIADMGTKQVERSLDFQKQYQEFDGYADLESVTMVDPESMILFFALENKARIVEYDYGKKKLLRVFDLPQEVKDDLDMVNNHGIESLTFVSAQHVRSGGYFYVGSQHTGSVHIVELPLLNGKKRADGLIDTKHISRWTPNENDKDLAGMDYDGHGHLFLNFDNGDRNTILVFNVDTATGLPDKDGSTFKSERSHRYGPKDKMLGCADLPNVKVPCARGWITDSEGIAVRLIDSNRWELLFSSDSGVAVFGYVFDLSNGLTEHPNCAKRIPPAAHGKEPARVTSNAKAVDIGWFGPLLSAWLFIELFV